MAEEFLMRAKGLYFIIGLIFSIVSTQAQIDNNKVIETDLFGYEPDQQSTQQNNAFEDALKQFQPSEITPFGSLEELAKKFPEFNISKDQNNESFARLKPKPKDVLVKKFFNGQDVSQRKIRTEIELGKIETNTKNIRIECRDHSYVDGDRVRVMVNEQVIRSNIVLKGGYYVLNIDLKEGFNRIDIQALNQGMSGPNTAEFNVYDGNGFLISAKEWNIQTGYVATLVVLKN